MMPIIRVLHITSSFPLQPESISGIFIYRMISHFPDKVINTVLTPDSRKTVTFGGNKCFQVKTVRYAPKEWQRLAHEAGGLPEALRNSKTCFIFFPILFISMLLSAITHARKSDIIHAHWTINGVIAGIAGKITRTPVIVTLRGEDASRSSTSFLHKFLLGVSIWMSNEVTTVSSKMKRNVIAAFPASKSKITFIPNGVSESLLAIPRPRISDRYNILVLGSLVPVKGVHIALTSLLKLSGNNNWFLRIVGKGPEYSKLRQIVYDGGISKNVEFLGAVPPEKIPDLLSDTDILIQASFREGRPNTVLEAMAAGVTIVGTDIEGINELIKHRQNGLLFPAGNVEKLAEQLRSLFQSHQFHSRLGQAGRRTILEQKLTWHLCSESYSNLYQELANKNEHP